MKNHHALLSPARLGAVCAGLLLALVPSLRAEVQVEVSFNDPGAAYRDYYAGLVANVGAGMRAWTHDAASNATLRIVVRFTDPNGHSVSLGHSFTGAYLHDNGTRRVFMEGAAAKLTGRIPDTDTAPDVDFFISPADLATFLWLDPDPSARTAPVPAGKLDAVSVFTSLAGHALGFNGYTNPSTGALPADYESAYDEHVTYNGSIFVFDGSNAVAVYGSPVPLYYKSVFNLGNPAPRPGADLAAHSVMNGVALQGGQRYYVTSVERAILKDTGLDLDHPAQTMVTVAATVPTADFASGSPGEITFSIPSALPVNLPIRYTLKGQAKNGVDFALLSGRLKILAGQTSAVLPIVPLQAEAETKPVKLTLKTSGRYVIGAKAKAKVKVVATP